MSLFSRSLVIASVILLAQMLGLAVPLVFQGDAYAQPQRFPAIVDAFASGASLIALANAGIAFIAFLVAFGMGGGWSYVQGMVSPGQGTLPFAVDLQPLRQAVNSILGDGAWIGMSEDDTALYRHTKRR